MTTSATLRAELITIAAGLGRPELKLLVDCARGLETKPIVPRLETVPIDVTATDGTASHEFWAHAAKNAAEVATWPSWKKTGVAISVPETDREMRKRL